MGAKERSSNFELLRIILMLMIVSLHVLYFGAVAYLTPGALRLAFLLESLLVCAVDVYVLISGYFGVTGTFQRKKAAKLWGTVFFYSVLFSAVSWFAVGPLEPREIIQTLLPVLTGRWWFVSAYIPMYFLSGVYNKALTALSQKQYRGLLAVGFVIFSLWPTLRYFSGVFIPPAANFGYSMFFMSYLYCVGGYFRRFPPKKGRPLLYGAGFLGCSAVAYGLARWAAGNGTGRFDDATMMWSYDAVWVFFAAVLLFLIFKEFKFHSNAINRIGGLTFAVYVIHEHPHVRPLLYDFLGWDAVVKDTAQFLPRFLFSVAFIFIGACLIEAVRRGLLFCGKKLIGVVKR